MHTIVTHRHSHKSKMDCAGYKRFTLDKMIAANTWKCLDVRAGRRQATQGELGHTEEKPQSTSSGMQGSTHSMADAEEDTPYVLPNPEKCNSCAGKSRRIFWHAMNARNYSTSRINAAAYLRPKSRS